MSLFSGRRLTNPDPFCIVLLFFPAGETQIWPGDLRVLAVLPGFLVWCWICIELWIFFRPTPSWHPPGRYTRSIAAKR